MGKITSLKHFANVVAVPGKTWKSVGREIQMTAQETAKSLAPRTVRVLVQLKTVSIVGTS